MSQWASLVVKFGALAFAVWLPHTFAINLQLLGGVWILQLLPMLVGGLFTRWFDRWALLIGLAGWHGATARIAAYNVGFPDRLALGVVVGHRVRRTRSTSASRAVLINIVIAVILTADPAGGQGTPGRRRDPAAPVHRRPGPGSGCRPVRASAPAPQARRVADARRKG